MSVFKVALSGPRGSGKTSLLKAMSDMPIISVEKRMIPGGDRLPLEYGRAFVSGTMMYFYCFDSIGSSDSWLKYLSNEMSFLLLAVDGTQPLADDWSDLARTIDRSWSHRVGILVTKLDSERYRKDAYRDARRMLPGRAWLLHRDRSHARSFSAELARLLEETGIRNGTIQS